MLLFSEYPDKSRNFTINTLLLPYFISHYSSAFTINQAPVVQTVDSAIRRINRYPLDSAIGFPNTYPLDSDLSGR